MPQDTQPGWLGKFIALMVSVVLLGVGLMFSLVLLAILAVVGVLILGYFWWKTRALREAMRDDARQHETGGRILDGEAVVIEEHLTIAHSPQPDNTSENARRP